ncbi:hypothetical protein SERLADRAFT_464074 [Serpula lacrymans var. lacrymans S7.9]|uniref:Uncharacterized protein n=1 Tax=Serpula lacrymans var. lacrymans (strain S7.9) TaxID=578457 RepID=F8NR69_SERL9|nr:uncharacterized protein SERLADRAFT_464074 [Serpula lacrymans var. lacrymans S7.9]EGO26716.1 hypothetical protein SERLADRAFT_464074 [Serpula lacrymans var. lacrymans S7.9]
MTRTCQITVNVGNILPFTLTSHESQSPSNVYFTSVTPLPLIAHGNILLQSQRCQLSMDESNCRNTPRRQHELDVPVPVLVPLAGIMTRFDSSAQPRINL